VQSLVPTRRVSDLSGLNINPHDARGIFQHRLDGVMGQITGTFGADITATPCAEEMATFDQFVTLLDEPAGDVVVFDTAPTGKTLRELAMPFDWAGFLANQIRDGKELAALMHLDEASFDALDRDRRRYDHALEVMRDAARTRFTLVLLPERLPIEETASAIRGLDRLGIEPGALVVNEVIDHDVIDGNRFLEARSTLQARYLAEIDTRFGDLGRARLPLLDRDVSDVGALRLIGHLLYGDAVSDVVVAAAGAR
jgi:arsenite-transporting ATPase